MAAGTPGKKNLNRDENKGTSWVLMVCLGAMGVLAAFAAFLFFRHRNKLKPQGGKTPSTARPGNNNPGSGNTPTSTPGPAPNLQEFS